MQDPAGRSRGQLLFFVFLEVEITRLASVNPPISLNIGARYIQDHTNTDIDIHVSTTIKDVH